MAGSPLWIFCFGATLNRILLKYFFLFCTRAKNTDLRIHRPYYNTFDMQVLSIYLYSKPIPPAPIMTWHLSILLNIVIHRQNLLRRHRTKQVITVNPLS